MSDQHLDSVSAVPLHTVQCHQRGQSCDQFCGCAELPLVKAETDTQPSLPVPFTSSVGYSAGGEEGRVICALGQMMGRLLLITNDEAPLTAAEMVWDQLHASSVLGWQAGVLDARGKAGVALMKRACCLMNLDCSRC